MGEAVKELSTQEILHQIALMEAIAAERGIELPTTAADLHAKVLGPLRERYRGDPVGFCEQVLGATLVDPIKEMMVSTEANRQTIAKSANATGKTHGAAHVALWFFLMWDDAKVFTAAAPPERNLRQLLWGEISAIVAKHPWLFADCKVGMMNIERRDKELNSFITGLTIPQSGSDADREGRFSGKHAPHMMFIIDEGDAVPEPCYKGVESCMSGQHERLLILFNPRASRGKPYELERDGRARVVEISAFSHPNVITGRNIVPGAVSRETTVRRINEWTRPLGPDEPIDHSETFEVPAFLVGATAEMSGGGFFAPLEPGFKKVIRPEFDYMVLARYSAQAEMQLISRAWISAARSRWDVYVALYGEVPPRGVPPIVGLDVAEYGKDPNVLVERYGGWVANLTTWRGVDVTETAQRAASICKTVGALRANVDAIGVGAGVAPTMRKAGVRAVDIKVSESPTKTADVNEAKTRFRDLRDQLWWEVREWLRTDSGAMLPPDEFLLEELAAPTYQPTKWGLQVTQKPVLREILGRSPDRAEALMFTFAPERDLLIGFVRH